MAEQSIAPADQTKWYRDWWIEVGKKFMWAGLLSLIVCGSVFLVALYFVVKHAHLAAMLEYSAIQIGR